VWDAGVLIGFPMVDAKVTLYDGPRGRQQHDRI
jgi:translation elongation factor EF-G